MSNQFITTAVKSNYRPNVGILIINAEGLIWAGERTPNPGEWQLPQGGIDAGDTILATAYRELEEETGITDAEVTLIGEHPKWLSYDFPAENSIEDTTNWQGQSQKWVAFSYANTYNNAILATAEHDEFSNWQWVTAQWILENVWQPKRPVYAEVFKHFNGHLA